MQNPDGWLETVAGSKNAIRKITRNPVFLPGTPKKIQTTIGRKWALKIRFCSPAFNLILILDLTTGHFLFG